MFSQAIKKPRSVFACSIVSSFGEISELKTCKTPTIRIRMKKTTNLT